MDCCWREENISLVALRAIPERLGVCEALWVLIHLPTKPTRAQNHFALWWRLAGDRIAMKLYSGWQYVVVTH